MENLIKYRTSLFIYGCLSLLIIYFNVGIYKSIFWDIFFYIPIVTIISFLSYLALKNEKYIVNKISIIILSSFFSGFFVYFAYSGLISQNYTEYEVCIGSHYIGLLFSIVLFILLFSLFLVFGKDGRD